MSEYYSLGNIISTHALKGEVKIFSTTDFNTLRYKKGSILYIEKDEKIIPVIVKHHRAVKDLDYVVFENYENIDAVLPFIKCTIYVKSDDLHKLSENEYYYHELIDSAVYHGEKYIGKVLNVVNYGAGDILVVLGTKEKELMIPFVNDFIKEVDVKNKIIKIEVIEGLLSDED